MNKIDHFYSLRCAENSDICQHLPTLKEYAEKCDVIVELGVRSIVSTWAFLAGRPKQLISVDIKHPDHYSDYDNNCTLIDVKVAADEEGIDFQFIQGSSLEVEIPECDMIFFDTLHTFNQLSHELALHANKAKKYLVFHDTVTYKDELMPAITNFLLTSFKKNWVIVAEFENNNGMLIMENQTK
jgi:hypothetical protein